MAVKHKHRRIGVAVDPENREEDDWYVTPPEGTEALLRVEAFGRDIWEPACGNGSIARVLEAANHRVFGTDLVYRGYGAGGVDFLSSQTAPADQIVTNAPFKLLLPFMQHAMSFRPKKLALLVRLAVLEGERRGKFFDEYPPARVWVFRKRLNIYRRGERGNMAGGMVAFCWMVWQRGHDGPTTLGWLK